MNKQSTIIALLIIFLTVSWGYSWPLMKIGLQYTDPFTFSFLRFFVGASVLLLILLLKKGIVNSFTNIPYKHVVVLGFLQTFTVFGLITYAMLFVDAGKTSIILYTMPIWSSVLAAVFLKETITRKNIIGLGLGLIGLLLIIGADIYQQASLENTIGIALILIASVSWAIANVYFRLKLSGTDSFAVTTFQMLTGALGLGVLALILEQGQNMEWTAESVFSIVFTGVIASAVCFSIWYYLLRVVNTITASISTLLVPVFGVLFGYLLLQEVLGTFMIFGAIFILSGIFISQTSFRKQ
ncbi:drug/metabolite transporter (DMT)-like permease [Salibacterium salarium]|uniref:DMT family transporter n=1 Tax=Salibacterium salarium TaxID=284579 RepID=UPI00277F0B97|nr:DMT family transporter [Salibacterium salarium]MDQ0300767.1 drug/metabolite transporter (DMT)-like permease [Salibacterium salarium]